MASLNLSINGPSIRSSYQGVVNSSIPSSSSPTYAHWALFSVQAPLLNAFQDSSAKESILKVESTGDGELADLIEDFNEGRIQFAYVKVKDPNTALPKNVLIAWCGGGVPERTKGYFTSHLNAVSKVLHGYHVQITARTDSDLEPDSIMKKVADASGSKYSAGSSAPASSGAAPPPVARKPVFTPTTSSSASSYNPLVAARRQKTDNVDEDGWGADAPPVTRSQLEKVSSAYQPTRVNIAELTSQEPEPSRFGGSRQEQDRSDVIRGAYQPVGKVDIAAIRAAAKNAQDDRPAPVKGSYEPVGKVDIAAIRARAQKPAGEAPAPGPESSEPPKSLAERSAAFSQSERLTELPKPKVAKKFGGASAFMGTKAPTPGGFGGFGAPAAPTGPPVGSASRTFADQGGKTPAQIWAEKKAKQGGAAPVGSPASPVTAQKSGGEWKSGYAGKSWAPVQTAGYGGLKAQTTGEEVSEEPEEPAAESGGVSALRDRFKNAQPMGGAAAPIPRTATGGEEEAAPPPLPAATRPTGAPSGGFALPGLPTRPPPPDEEEPEEEEPPFPEREESPPRVAIPVPRGREPEIEAPAERFAPPPLPTQEVEQGLPREEELPAEQESHDLARGAATAVAEEQFGHEQVAASHPAQATGKTAVVQYDYDKAEDNELELREGDYVTNIDMVDDDWWMGTNTHGETGLFPSNYVELVEGGAAAPAPPPAPAAHEPEPEPEPEAPSHSAGAGHTAIAQYDYEAAEDNELSFPEGAQITDMEFPDEDWWFGHYNGQSGLFPANYVEREN